MKPDIRDRIARHDEMNAERERNETVRMNRVIEHMRRQEEHERRIRRMEFDLYLLADRILHRLERMRDENRPKSYSEDWNDGFCTAIANIREARAFAEECEMRCIEVKKDG